MNLSLIAIRKVLPQFNENAVTETDFWKIAKKHKIIVRMLPLVVKGYYKAEADRHYIFIDSRLTGVEFLRTALHELYHYLLSAPPTAAFTAKYRRGSQADLIDHHDEQMAEYFAVIAMMPYSEFVRRWNEGLPDDNAEADLVITRYKAYSDLGV